MSVLTSPFPMSLTINGVECPINPDFRTVLRCYEIQGDKAELSQEELLKILLLFYKKQRMFTEEHVNKMYWFFSLRQREGKETLPQEDCRDKR